jgi:hypothetical protein
LSICSGGQVVADELLPQTLYKLVEAIGIVRACRYQLGQKRPPRRAVEGRGSMAQVIGEQRRALDGRTHGSANSDHVRE